MRELSDAAEHLNGADENLAFAEQLRNDTKNAGCAIRWAVTCLFYASLHEIRGYLLAKHGVQLVSHEDMRNQYDKYPELKRTKNKYTTLKEHSEAARYYLADFTWPQYDQMRTSLLEPIKNAWRPKTVVAAQSSR